MPRSSGAYPGDARMTQSNPGRRVWITVQLCTVTLTDISIRMCLGEM